jgi:hypothetical protein
LSFFIARDDAITCAALVVAADDEDEEDGATACVIPSAETNHDAAVDASRNGTSIVLVLS